MDTQSPYLPCSTSLHEAFCGATSPCGATEPSGSTLYVLCAASPPPRSSGCRAGKAWESRWTSSGRASRRSASRRARRDSGVFPPMPKMPRPSASSRPCNAASSSSERLCTHAVRSFGERSSSRCARASRSLELPARSDTLRPGARRTRGRRVRPQGPRPAGGGIGDGDRGRRAAPRAIRSVGIGGGGGSHQLLRARSGGRLIPGTRCEVLLRSLLEERPTQSVERHRGFRCVIHLDAGALTEYVRVRPSPCHGDCAGPQQDAELGQLLAA